MGTIEFCYEIIDDKLRIYSSILLSIDIIYSFYLLYLTDITLCEYQHKLIVTLYILPLPICLLVHINIIRWYDSIIEYVDRLSHYISVILQSFISVILGFIILIQSWSCSVTYLRLAYAMSIIVSLYVCTVFLRSFWRNFIFTQDNQAKQSLLYLIRCWCFTRRFKKALLVSPYFFLTVYVLINLGYHWSDYCTLPVQYYCLTSSASFLLMGMAGLMLLNYGRRRIHLNESSEQLIDSTHQLGTSKLPHSTTASDILALANDSKRCISLSVLWYFAGGIHLFGLLWGILGIFWSGYKDTCSHGLIEDLTICIIFLIILSISGILLSWIFKVESCFPAALDPSHFHSHRTRTIRPHAIDSTIEIGNDNGHLDDSNTSLLHRASGDGILNHQYGKSSRISTHIDIELNGRHSRYMNVGDGKTKFTSQKVNTPVYSRIPV